MSHTVVLQCLSPPCYRTRRATAASMGCAYWALPRVISTHSGSPVVLFVFNRKHQSFHGYQEHATVAACILVTRMQVTTYIAPNLPVWVSLPISQSISTGWHNFESIVFVRHTAYIFIVLNYRSLEAHLHYFKTKSSRPAYPTLNPTTT